MEMRFCTGTNELSMGLKDVNEVKGRPFCGGDALHHLCVDVGPWSHSLGRFLAIFPVDDGIRNSPHRLDWVGSNVFATVAGNCRGFFVAAILDCPLFDDKRKSFLGVCLGWSCCVDQ